MPQAQPGQQSLTGQVAHVRWGTADNTTWLLCSGTNRPAGRSDLCACPRQRVSSCSASSSRVLASSSLATHTATSHTARRRHTRERALALAPVRDAKQHNRLARLGQWLVNDEVALALKLDDLTLLQRPHVGVTERRTVPARVRVDVVLKRVVVLELFLRDQVVKLGQLQLDQLVDLRQPVQLDTRLLKVARQVQRRVNRRRRACCAVAVHLVDDRVAPVHQCDLLAILHVKRVGLVDPDLRRPHLALLARWGVLLVARHRDHLQRLGAARQRDRDLAVALHRRVARAHWVDELLVHRPDLVPLLVRHILRRTLREDELLEHLHLKAASDDALHRRHARVVPARHAVGLHKPRELAFGQDRVDEVEP
mmetsp:Transcript_42977/g.129010  ORF Transcript_42977/g.129010 Transcript_42977/m.129010 type:complete len:367 (+) Transcript_42977:121-1221(+)